MDTLFDVQLADQHAFTLPQLKEIQDGYIAIGKENFPTLVKIIKQFGTAVEVKNWGTWFVMEIESLQNVTITYHETSDQWNKLRNAPDINEIIYATAGSITDKSLPFARRELLICRLQFVNGEFKFDSGATFVPGQWLDDILTYKDQAEGLIEEAAKEIVRKQRNALARKLLIGVEI